MLMDQGFKIITGIAQTGLKTGLIITNLSRQMLIKAWTKRKAQEWVASIESAMETNTGSYYHSIPFLFLMSA
jgi:phospholipase D1/2